MGDSVGERDALRQRFARIRLLNEELDRLTLDTSERAASVSNKASFLAVSAGVLITASTSQLWSELAWFGIVALLLGCAGLVCAAVALRPGRRLGLVAQRLADSYIDTTRSALVIETELVRSKSKAIAHREGDLAARAGWVWAGFALLVLASVSLSAVFTAQLLGG